MSEWRPIETAPRDGSPVLLWDGLGIVIAHWWEPDPEDFEDDDEFEPEAIWISTSNEGEEFISEPTHWMSLPEPPK